MRTFSLQPPQRISGSANARRRTAEDDELAADMTARSCGGKKQRRTSSRQPDSPAATVVAEQSDRSGGGEGVKDLRWVLRVRDLRMGNFALLQKDPPCKIGRIETNNVAVNSWSNPPPTHRVRATVTVFSRHIVLSDRIERIPEFSDRIVLQSQLE